MIHRRPGDALTQAPWEQAFPITQQWVGEEATGSEAGGFTRVLLGGLKPEVLHQMLEEGADSRICRVGLKMRGGRDRWSGMHMCGEEKWRRTARVSGVPPHAVPLV